MNSRIVLALIFCIAAVTSCKKHNDNVFLANEATLGFDGYAFTDSFRLLTSTIREDSIKTDSLSQNLVGVINDAVFGKYQASSFFQFKLTQLNNVLSAQKLDSVILIMQYTSKIAYYGDLNSNISFDVVEVNTDMSSSLSHSTQNIGYDPTPIGSFSGRFRPGTSTSDSIVIRELGKNVRIAPSISIKLSSAFANKLFKANAAQLTSQESFMKFFKGLGLVPTANPSFGSGAIASLNLFATFSKIRIYYNDTLQADFKVQNDSRRFSKYEVSNQGAEITKQKSSPKGNFDTTYAMAMAGAKTYIRIPHLFGIIKDKNKKIAIGKAEVIVRPLAGTFTSPFTLPKRMLILQPDAKSYRNAGILDLVEFFYGGDYNATKNEYRFNITRHIQDIFSDYQLNGINNNRGLYLTIPTDDPIAPSRIILDMRKKLANAGIEFRLVYTEL